MKPRKPTKSKETPKLPKPLKKLVKKKLARVKELNKARQAKRQLKTVLKRAEKDIAAKDDFIKVLRQKMAQDIVTYGFHIHYVFGVVAKRTPKGPEIRLANIHTHGLTETFGHNDLQIVFPLEPEVASGILHTIVDTIQKGKKYKNGETVEEILKKGYKIRLQRFTEGDRKVLRIILPDKEGNLNPKTGPFADQTLNLEK